MTNFTKYGLKEMQEIQAMSILSAIYLVHINQG
jgi:hypothetical protein